MTGIDGAALFVEYLNTTIQLVLSYVSILSAFLVMSYFAAEKLGKWLMVIVLALFSLVCFMLVMQITLTRNDMAELYAFLLQQQDPDLAWFGSNPPWALKMLTYLHFMVTIAGYLGCLAFFLRQRALKMSK